ncbi:MAG: serine hydrolase [Planctomycetota bacterium]
MTTSFLLPRPRSTSRRRTSFLAPWCALAISSMAAVSGQIAAYHDQTLAQQQSQYLSLKHQGYRPITLAMYDSPSAPRFAAVWVRRSGPDFVGFHAVTSSGYQSLFDAWTAQGYVPSLLSAVGSGSSIRLSGIFVQSTSSLWAVHDVTQSRFDQVCSDAQSQGFILTSATVYGTSSSPLFAGVWLPNVGNVQWGYGHSADGTEFQAHFAAWGQQWMRPTHVTLSSYGRYLSIWHDTQLQGGWVAAHGMTSSGYQSTFDTQWTAGNYPICVQAGGSGTAARFAAIFAPNETVVARTFTATGTAVAGLSAFDDYVRNLMQAANVRGGSLAVIKDGRLMLARGYTWAEPGYPTTQPTSLFRIASSSKALTSLGVHRAMENSQGLINDSTRMLGVLPPITPLDARTGNITLLHLLTHRGGWDTNMLGFDPVFRDLDVASYHGHSVPVNKYEIYRYMTLSQGLQFTPDSRGAYSNYGFMMAGRALEALNGGLAYEAVIRRDVFAPLGVVRAKVGDSRPLDSNEVRYHLRYPYLDRSVVVGTRPWIAPQYGAWNQANLDANGGWVLATCDYAKVLAALSLGDRCPILGGAYIDRMWTPHPAGSTTLRGWFTTNVVSNGRTRVLRHHNGGLPGTAAHCVLRDDGFGFCLFLNQDRGLGDAEAIALSHIADQVAQWPNHDLFPSVSIPSLRAHVTGTFGTFGSGCRGTAGIPAHSGRGTPEVDQTFTLEVGGAPASTPIVWMLGFSRTSWNGVPLPLSLGPWGAPGCSLWAAPNLTVGDASGRTGAGSVSLRLPANPSLIGGHLYTQVSCVDPRANSLGLAYSNGLDVRIGGWQ